MHNLPKPILGEITAFTITTPDLERSLAFYQMLGYAEVMRADWPFPWIQVSDGVVLIMLREDAKPYIALTYYVKNIDDVIKNLEEKGIRFTQKAKPKDMIKRYLLVSPDGLNISVVSVVDGFRQPPGPGMLAMKQEDYFIPEKYVNKTSGLFGEFAHPVSDLDVSLGFWQLLGFSVVSKFTSPYPWAIISDGLSIVGLHQSAHFTDPAITYFAADMADKIGMLKKKGLKNIKEKSPGNVVVTTPEGQQVFLFSLSGGGSVKQKEVAMPPRVVLETARLLLKEVSPEIREHVHTTMTDEEIMTFMGLKTEEELRIEKDKFLKGMTTYRLSYKSFQLVDMITNEIIGTCGYHNWYREHSRAEIGYAMVSDEVKGKGYMTEAINAIIAFGFEKMNLNRIEAFIGSGNEPSLRVVKRLGFTQEGVLRSHYFKNDKMEDSVCFSLLKSEYKPLKKGKKK